jgi:hypothetical protein
VLVLCAYPGDHATEYICDSVTGRRETNGGGRKRAHVRDGRANRAVPSLPGNNASRDLHESIADCAMLHRSRGGAPTGRSTRRTVLVQEPNSPAPIRIQPVEQGEQLHTGQEGEGFRS